MIDGYKEQDPPKTVGLDYSFGKLPTSAAQPDVIANFYEVGGGPTFANLIDIAITPSSVVNSCIVIVLDLSKVLAPPLFHLV
jgi:hypothetical protein